MTPVRPTIDGGGVANASLERAAWDVLASVEDPELPIAITDLGLVRDVRVDAEPDSASSALGSRREPETPAGSGAGARVSVRLVPTWTACPALAVIRGRVREGLLAIPGVRDVSVEYTYDEPWTVERMTSRGRAQLAAHGLAVPACRFAEPPVCPYCGSRDVQMESLFGPTLCRSTYVCRHCRNPFERFKPPAEP